jgi:hypothetical protein
MKSYGGVDVQIHIFLTSTLAGGARSAVALTPPKETTVPFGWEVGWTLEPV